MKHFYLDSPPDKLDADLATLAGHCLVWGVYDPSGNLNVMFSYLGCDATPYDHIFMYLKYKAKPPQWNGTTYGTNGAPT